MSDEANYSTNLATTTAEITNTLKDHQFIHIPRLARRGGGVGILLRKGLVVRQNDIIQSQATEYMDLTISCNHSNRLSIRLITIYRPPPSEKNNLTMSMFLQDFSTLLEHLTTVPEHLIFIGDFNVHMDDPTNSDAAKFADLLDSAGLIQRVTGATHKRGHTLDLLIHREDDTILAGNIDIVSDLSSDHFAIVCPLAMAKPKPSKLILKCRNLRRIDMKVFRSDILNSSLHSATKTCDTNALTMQYNSIMCNLIDKHAPGRT